MEPARVRRVEPVSLLDLVKSVSIGLPRKQRHQRAFFRFLRKAGSDRKFLGAVHGLRDSVILSTLREKSAMGGVTIALSGAAGGEGTSLLSILLGLSLGECVHRRVAILDGRFNLQRFAVLSELLGLSRNSVTLQKGANEMMAYYNEACPNIYFLRSSNAEQSMHFFSDKRLGLFLAELRKNFDFTVLDLPPILNEAASVFALPYVDRFYLVAEARKTRLSRIGKCIATVREAGGQLTGVILNKQQIPLWGRLFWREFFY
jgi:Mrp family chromosome partitioning ATPase